MDYVDPNMLHASNYTGQVTLWHSVSNRTFSSFDVLTGNEIQLNTRLSVAGGFPSVTFTGIPGWQVAVEISTDLKVWTDTGSVVTLDVSGKGVYTPSHAQPRLLFFRGRLK